MLSDIICDTLHSSHALAASSSYVNELGHCLSDKKVMQVITSETVLRLARELESPQVEIILNFMVTAFVRLS